MRYMYLYVLLYCLTFKGWITLFTFSYPLLPVPKKNFGRKFLLKFSISWYSASDSSRRTAHNSPLVSSILSHFNCSPSVSEYHLHGYHSLPCAQLCCELFCPFYFSFPFPTFPFLLRRKKPTFCPACSHALPRRDSRNRKWHRKVY